MDHLHARQKRPRHREQRLHITRGGLKFPLEDFLFPSDFLRHILESSDQGRRAHAGLDAGRNFILAGGLAEKVIGSASQAFGDLLRLIMTRHHEDLTRQQFRIPTNLFAEREAVHFRHHPIQDGQIGPLASERFQPGLSISGFDHAIAEPFESSRQGHPRGGFIIHDQDGTHPYLDAIAGRCHWSRHRMRLDENTCERFNGDRSLCLLG